MIITEAPPDTSFNTSVRVKVTYGSYTQYPPEGGGTGPCYVLDETPDTATFTFTVNSVDRRSYFTVYHDSAVAVNLPLTVGVTNTLTATIDGFDSYGMQTTHVVTRLTYVQAGAKGVAVRPELPERQHVAVTQGSQRLFVKNLQTVSATFTLTAFCSGTTTGCAVAPTSLTLTPGESKVATLTHTVGAAGTTGGGMVKAVDASATSLRDSASIALTSVGALFPVVSITDVNPGTTIERDQCLTIAAASAAAYECGDLRIIHPLPAIRTLNKARVPTLLYNSATADPYPIVAASVTLASVPDSVEAILRVGSVTRDSGRWAGTDWASGATRRIALRAMALSDTMPAADTSKVIGYTLEVATIYLGPSGSRNATAVDDALIVVNRRRSSFGAGWWLAGLERLHPGLTITIPWQGGWLTYPTTLMWVGEMGAPGSTAADPAYGSRRT
jgi:hypothetical protein